MRFLLGSLFCLMGVGLHVGSAAGQTVPPPAVGPAATPAEGMPTSGDPAESSLPPEEIGKLVAPIALYPDVLVSLVLPASTFPIDIVKAARWLRSKPDMAKLPEQEWDLSVLSLCHYPDVIYKMDEDIDWTSALGATFLSQQADVMEAIQRLRQQASAKKVLETTKEQTVVVEDEMIRIVPTQTDVVYVPTYNPEVVYVEDDDDDDVAAALAASAISFGAGMAMGSWLCTDCHWYGGCVSYCRPGYWGGWAHRGAVAFGDDWFAAVGPRRGLVMGENGGIYRGPRGGAVWGDDGRGAAWARPTPYNRPTYSGRYSSFNNYARGSVGNRANLAAGNNVNLTRNNVNIDRGDRNTAIGGNRNTAIGANRTPGVGANRPGVGPRPGTATQLPASGSAFAGRGGSQALSSTSQRGLQSRSASAGTTSGIRTGTGATARPGYTGAGTAARPGGYGSGTARPSAGGSSSARPSYSGPSARPSYSGSSAGRSSSFSSQRSASQARSSSSRGSSSRSFSGGSRGGGGRGGGGRGGRR